MAKPKSKLFPLNNQVDTPRSPVTPESQLQGNGGSRRMPRGTKRMRQFGYKRLELWLDKAEREVIEEYSRFAGKATATWIRRLAFETAAAELAKAGKRKGASHV